MECPICKYPVLADGSTCRRCGAPLHVPIIGAKVPGRTALLGKRAPGAGSRVETPAAPPAPPTSGSPPSHAARAAEYLKHAPADGRLPGAFSRRDNLLPRATRSTGAGAAGPAAPGRSAAQVTVRVGPYTVPIVGARSTNERSLRRHWRRGVVTGVAAVALTLSAIAVWPVAFGGRTSPTAGAAALNQTRATDLLRRVVTAARGSYALQSSYTGLSSESLSALTRDVPVVRSSIVAGAGAVSLRVNDPRVLTLASPAGAHRCVFARDNAARDATMFVTVSTADCRASAAPASGWSTR